MPPIQVFRGFKHNKFVMTEIASSLLERAIFDNVTSLDLLDQSRPWLFPIPINGLWNCAPSGDSPGYAFELLHDGAAPFLDNDNAYLCFDAAGEGFPVDSDIFENIETQLAKLSVPPNRALMLTSDVLALARYRTWAIAHSRSLSFVPVPFDAQFYYLSGRYREKRNVVEDIYHRALRRSVDKPVAPKKFLSFNYTPRAHRFALVLYLYDHDLLRDGLVSFHGPSIDNGPGDSGWQDLAAVKIWLRQLGSSEREIGRLEEFLALCPLKIEEKERFALAYDVGDPEPYFDTTFSIVTETAFRSADSELRLTEKTFKAIANAHPFVICGNPGLLSLLRSRGFQTFSPLIDETYDAIDDPTRRFAALRTEIARLCALPPRDLADLYAALWPAISHNFSLFHFGAGPMLELDPATVTLRNLPLSVAGL